MKSHELASVNIPVTRQHAAAGGLKTAVHKPAAVPPNVARFHPQAGSPVGNIASLAFLFFLFLTLSRFHEALTIMLGVRAYLYTIALIPLLPIALLSGRWVIPWKSVPGMMFLGFSVWMILGLPFSIWRGGVFEQLKDVWSQSLITFMLVGGMIGSLRQMRSALYTSGLSMLVVLLLYLRFSAADQGGRVAFEFGTLSNSNDLAMHLLLGLPFLMFIIVDQKRVSFLRVTAIGAALCTILVIFRTGSRGALLGFACLLIAMFFLTSFSGKLKLVFAAFLVFALVVTTAPESVINRYKTLWEDNTDEDGNLDEATMSALGRKELLFESIRQTFVHPIFGLGAGNFPVAYSKKLESEGIFHHGYRASHNSYTQISSETGIPGLVFFLTAMGWCFRHTIRLYRWASKSPGQKQIANLAISVFLSLLTFSVTAFFSSQGYRFYLPLLAGLTVALKNAVEQSRATPGILRV